MARTRSSYWFHLLLVSAITARIAPATGDTLEYVLRPMPETNTIAVTITWATESRTQSHLSITDSWAYINQPVRFVKKLSIIGGVVDERDDNHWAISHDVGETISAQYIIDPQRRSFDWDRLYEPITWRKFFHGIGHTFLITPDPDVYGTKPFDVSVRWQLPDGWDESVCSFGVGDVSARMQVQDIRHSVYLAGDLDLQTTQINGSRVTVAMYDLFSFNLAAFQAVTTKIMQAEIAFMQERGFPDFVITVIPVGDPQTNGSSHRGGTGLFRSLALFLPPMSKLDDDFAFLFAHELFHYWNGRVLNRMEPEELVYWISEGFTDYYAMRILLESSPHMHAALAARLTAQYGRYARNEAIKASNEDVRQRFWSSPETYGELPYQRGMILAIRWHHMARQRGIEDGIDRLFKHAVDQARREGYRLSNESFRAMGIEQLGDWFGDEFDRFVEGAEIVTLPLDSMHPYFAGEETVAYGYDIGFDFDASRDAGRVRGLIDSSAAAKAGLREGDRLTGWSVRFGDPDFEVALTVQRERAEQEIRFFPRGEAIKSVRFTPVDE